jgi:hypothetical protein
MQKLHWRHGLLILAFLCAVSCSQAATNVDPAATGAARYAWVENAGWLNLYGNGADGVVVSPDYLQGLAWLENCGWVSFGQGAPAGVGNHYTNSAPNSFTLPDFGVNNDRVGNLWGLAWAENVGWINLGNSAGQSFVRIDPATGRFSGNAWSENCGWISFSGVPAADVATVPASAVPVRISAFSAD